MLRFGNRRSGSRRHARTAIVAAVVSCVAVVAAASAAVSGFDPFGNAQVGQAVNGAILLPTNQWISPLGNADPDNNARLVSSTISPDGSYLAALSWNDFTGYLTIFDLKTGTDRPADRRLATGAGPTRRDSVAADGPLYSPDGKTLWVPQTADLLRVHRRPVHRRRPRRRPSIPLSDSSRPREPTATPTSDPATPAAPPALGHGALARRQRSSTSPSTAPTPSASIDTATNTLTSRSRSATRRARSCSPTAERPPTSPTRAVVRPPRTTSPTSPTAPRSSPDRSTGAATTGTVSVVDLDNGQARSSRSRSGCSRPRSTSDGSARCSSPTPTTTACRSSTSTPTR